MTHSTTQNTVNTLAKLSFWYNNIFKLVAKAVGQALIGGIIENHF